MINFKSKSVCEQARIYYYDYLCDKEQVKIPEEILSHISQCSICQSEVDRLEGILAESQKNPNKNIRGDNSAVITNAKLHFAYIGKAVSCNTVRPFLPSLVDPLLDIGIPTPITVHLDKCQQCTDGLETIRFLNLTHIQLCRLGQIFAERPFETAISCSEALDNIATVVLMDFQKTNSEVLRHFCICPDCRKTLFHHRGKICEELLQAERVQDEFPCEAVTATDIFDYCFPYGIDPADDQYAKFRPSFTNHASKCPTCLGKMQDLHKTVYDILEQGESEIVTCYKVADEAARDSNIIASDDIYEDWPIEVQMFDKSKEASLMQSKTAEDTTSSRRLEQKPSMLRIKSFIKPAAIAAAVLLAAFLLLNIPVAKAVDLNEVYNALKQVKNVCITVFDQEKPKPSQEMWISQALNIRLYKTENQFVLWDFKNKFQKTKNLITAKITTVKPDDDDLIKVKEAMKAPWDLLPFSSISAVPQDAEWQEAADEYIDATIPKTEVYDLVWTEKSLIGSIIYEKCRVFLDIEIMLPKRIEQWRKIVKEGEYELLTITTVVYPTTAEIQTVIKDAGF